MNKIIGFEERIEDGIGDHFYFDCNYIVVDERNIGGKFPLLVVSSKRDNIVAVFSLSVVTVTCDYYVPYIIACADEDDTKIVFDEVTNDILKGMIKGDDKIFAWIHGRFIGTNHNKMAHSPKFVEKLLKEERTEECQRLAMNDTCRKGEKMMILVHQLIHQKLYNHIEW